MTTPFFITTPIYYVNARPHLGHAYTTIVADVATRFHRMKAAETFFLTGTDEHGDKIVRAAKAENLSPRSYVDQISAIFQQLWPQLNVSNDYFVRTTDTDHMAVVEQLLQKIYDAGEIYFSEYEGLYCFGCERFYAERELVDGKCPDHETEPETIRESNYFFKMSKYQQWLIDHIEKHPDFIRPERYRNEVLAMLREPLEDLCISRPKSRLQWGITLPFDHDYVTYVWFDALLNYVSALGYPNGDRFHTFWPQAQHVVAKDILKPHAIYWPIMLKAAGIDIYQHLNVHGFWRIGESKMSKSLGNMVEPLALKNIYGVDAFRYFLMREMSFGLDANFTEDALVQRINADLANDLGNLFSRVLAMAHKYFGGVIPQADPEADIQLSGELADQAGRCIDLYEEAMESFGFHQALRSVWEYISHLNKYIDVTAPWVLAKQKSCRPQLKAVIVHLLEGLRLISGLLYPVMPETARIMQKHLGLDPDAPFYRLDVLRRPEAFAPETQLPRCTTLFPRIELPMESEKAPDEPQPSAPIFKPTIGFEDFKKVDLRVGTVLSAATIPKAKKLLQLQVDVGEKRTIVAGIAGSYTPEQLVGQQVIVVVNLKPAKLMGVESQGMVLAAVDDRQITLTTVGQSMDPGTPVQ